MILTVTLDVRDVTFTFWRVLTNMIKYGKCIYFQVIPRFSILFDNVGSLSYCIHSFRFSRASDRIRSYHDSQHHIHVVSVLVFYMMYWLLVWGNLKFWFLGFPYVLWNRSNASKFFSCRLYAITDGTVFVTALGFDCWEAYAWLQIPRRPSPVSGLSSTWISSCYRYNVLAYFDPLLRHPGYLVVSLLHMQIPFLYLVRTQSVPAVERFSGNTRNRWPLS